ncbi:MAG: hypothetical protein J6Y48_10715 [Clostridia bacterium]|nr:hypothetical protein [Clostridia bacterium]
MTVPTAKEFFRQVLTAEKELKVLNRKLEHYEEIGLSIGGSSGVVGNKNRGSSRVELAAIGAVDVMRELIDQQKAYMAIIARAEQVIRGIKQDRYRQILNFRYLCGMSFRSISDELKYNDPNSVYRAHGWALHEAQKIINAQEKEKAAQS